MNLCNDAKLKIIEDAINIYALDKPMRTVTSLPREPDYMSGCYDDDSEDRANRSDANHHLFQQYKNELTMYLMTNYTLKELCRLKHNYHEDKKTITENQDQISMLHEKCKELEKINMKMKLKLF